MFGSSEAGFHDGGDFLQIILRILIVAVQVQLLLLKPLDLVGPKLGWRSFLAADHRYG